MFYLSILHPILNKDWIERLLLISFNTKYWWNIIVFCINVLDIVIYAVFLNVKRVKSQHKNIK